LNIISIILDTLLIAKTLAADRPRPMSRKTSEVGVLKLSCLSDEGASLDGLSQLSVSFSSEAGKLFFPLFPLQLERVAKGRVRSLDLFCFVFWFKPKNEVGFGAGPNNKMLYHDSILDSSFIIFQRPNYPTIQILFVGRTFFDDINVIGNFSNGKRCLKMLWIHTIKLGQCLITNNTINMNVTH